MPTRDFFVFCTSLPPIELRSLGGLSKVRHIPEGQIIYRPGDPSDALFIINRGTVDLSPAKAKGGSSVTTLLSRGDIFGDLEVLTDGPRRGSARARQAVSLQCFERDNLPEMLRRVPSFYRFLCEHLAHRLLLMREAALVRANELELSGNLANFDLVTVYQTIVQSSQTGALSVMDEDGELVAGFRFSAGQPLGGHFLHLTGEEAFWQLFLAHNLRGTFSFASGTKDSEDFLGPAIARSANDMLFAAVQYRDEIQELKAEMPPDSVYETQQTDLDLGLLDLAISEFVMEEVWRCASEAHTPISGFFARCTVCELKIYQAVRELVRTGHLALAMTEEAQQVA
ncbi:MAG: cyclic nucleotide-binding domain-containing protein [Chthoniobacterales bacterium]